MRENNSLIRQEMAIQENNEPDGFFQVACEEIHAHERIFMIILITEIHHD